MFILHDLKLKLVVHFAERISFFDNMDLQHTFIAWTMDVSKIDKDMLILKTIAHNDFFSV